MVINENLNKIFDDILSSSLEKGTAKDWKLVGQEQNGNLLVSWNTYPPDKGKSTYSSIGLYSHDTASFEVLYTFDSLVNVVQATISLSKRLLGFVLKTRSNTNCETNKTSWVDTYKPYISAVRDDGVSNSNLYDLEVNSSQQVFVQFLYRKKSSITTDKFLLFIHHEGISLCQVQLKQIEEDVYVIDGKVSSESLVRSFTWSQWDPVLQSLYYIHYRKTQASVEGEEPTDNKEDELVPTLSCLQFHDELPHETVLNIPLNLPQLPKNNNSLCGVYEDDPIPLRVHDCSLDLQIVCDPKGIVSICHHYLYQSCTPLPQPVLPTSHVFPSPCIFLSHMLAALTLRYDVSTSQCIQNVTGLFYTDEDLKAKIFDCLCLFTIVCICNSGFTISDQHMVVYAPGLFTHLLDIGLGHEPCCHVLMGCILPSELSFTSHITHLVPFIQSDGILTVDLISLDLVPITITTEHLVETYKTEPCLENRLAILHYFLVHQGDMETVTELLSLIADQPLEPSVPQLLQETLVAGAYASAQKFLPSDALPLVSLLPLTTTTTTPEFEMKINRLSMTLTQETLWNTAMMLLSPQQRIIPYRTDMWTQLWDQLAKKTNKENKEKPRFRPSQVADKLIVSLVCYQPEALSRSSTPLSPGTSLVGSGTLADLANITSSRKSAGVDSLPFFEIESCTASKQEHVISVNLRELSMHLLKHTNKLSPMHIHAVATRYVAAQLELSKQLCQLLSLSAAVNPHQEQEKGFALIDQLDESRRYVLFLLLERYYYAVDSLAFPLPQGFTSFYTFLGYRTLSFPIFLQYVQKNVFELQVDVMKAIMADIEDTKEGVKKKLQLLLLLPRSRAKRLLNQWSHPVSLMIRAREHALNILSGVEGAQTRGHSSQRSRTAVTTTRGLAAFPSADRLSPLDTFLDLLTAKASLAELDFGLLVEATVTSTEDFL